VSWLRGRSDQIGGKAGATFALRSSSTNALLKSFSGSNRMEPNVLCHIEERNPVREGGKRSFGATRTEPSNMGLVLGYDDWGFAYFDFSDRDYYDPTQPAFESTTSTHPSLSTA